MSVTYSRHPNPKIPGGYMYRKDTRMVSPARVPQYALERFALGAPTVDYDDHPELPRCLFCEAYKTQERLLSGVTVALCDHHYYAKNIGQIAQRLREIKEKEHGGAQSKRTSQDQQSESGNDRHSRRDAQAARSSSGG